MMEKMPALFVGHGSPMNAIEDNRYTREWQKIALQIPKPQTILSVSAHWFTKGTKTSDMENPRTIYDMYGFPDELYQVKYPAPGSSMLARLVQESISREVSIDNTWGIDHGTWSVLCRMFPQADIPVCQLSIDSSAPPETHYQLGQEIAQLRGKGVLVMGSGNIVHNLARVNWQMEGGYPWAEQFDGYIREKIVARQHRDVIDYTSAGQSAQLAFTTPEHFYPLLYVLGATSEADQLTIFNDSCALGSISMTGYLFQ